MECKELLFLYVTRRHTHRDRQTKYSHTRALTHTHAYKNKLHLYEDWRWPAHHIFSLSKQRQSRSLTVEVAMGDEEQKYRKDEKGRQLFDAIRNP